MTIFRPMIDLHHGFVKKLVGGTLDPHDPKNVQLRTNFQSEYVIVGGCEDGVVWCGVVIPG